MWKKRLSCRCGYYLNGNLYSSIPMNSMAVVCPKCGNTTAWQDTVERFIYTGIWYNPASWFSGYWEIKK